MGNKIDCSGGKTVTTEVAQAFAEENDLQLYQTSAKDDVNIQEVAKQTTLIIHQHSQIT